MINTKETTLWICVDIVLLIFVMETTSYMNYDGYKVLSIIPSNSQQVKVLEEIWHQGKYDFWQPPHQINSSVDVLIPPHDLSNFFSFLNINAYQYSVMVDNVTKEVESEEKHQPSFKRLRRSSRVDWFSFQEYHRYYSIMNFLEDLERNYLGLVRIETIGTSHENRKIQMVKICNGACGRRPGIWIDGGIHAREWISPATALFFIKKLVTENGKNYAIRQLVENLDWYIVPLLNPDGYEYTHTRARFWRKNRRACNESGGIDGRKCCGVDLNRNYDWFHGGVGTTNNPCSDVYSGKTAFSEPETLAVKNFVESHRNSIEVFMSMHSYAQKWLYAYGTQWGRYPTNLNEVASLASKAAERLKESYGTEYGVGSTADQMYLASGLAADWATGKMQIRFVYSLELRPCNVCTRTGFLLKPQHILPTAQETWNAVEIMAEQVMRKKGTLSARYEGLIREREKEGSRKKEKWTATPTTTTTAPRPWGRGSCWDRERPKQCMYWSTHGYCSRKEVQRSCRFTCGQC